MGDREEWGFPYMDQILVWDFDTSIVVKAKLRLLDNVKKCIRERKNMITLMHIKAGESLL